MGYQRRITKVAGFVAGTMLFVFVLTVGLYSLIFHDSLHEKLAFLADDFDDTVDEFHRLLVYSPGPMGTAVVAGLIVAGLVVLIVTTRA